MSTVQSLKDSGLKATLPRRKILELFEGSKVRHLSAEDVYKALIAEGIDVGLATVYRVLTQFEQAGLLARQHFETGKAMFELNQGGHHDHLLCLQCGRSGTAARANEAGARSSGRRGARHAEGARRGRRCRRHDLHASAHRQ
jgi:Fe2+ or Zn2+ uptake regulation protein